MLINRLPELMERRGVSIRQLSRETSVTYTTIWALYHGQRRSVQLEVLDAVCEVLQIQPGQIYQHISDAGQRPPGPTTRFSPHVKPETSASEKPVQPARKDRLSDWRSW